MVVIGLASSIEANSNSGAPLCRVAVVCIHSVRIYTISNKDSLEGIFLRE